MRYCVHQSMPLLLLAGFPECCTPKSPPPLSCSSEFASYTFSILPTLVCFFLLLLSSSSRQIFGTLLSSEPEDVFTLLSQKLDWSSDFCCFRNLSDLQNSSLFRARRRVSSSDFCCFRNLSDLQSSSLQSRKTTILF